ncbi:MAG TPA: hypothetical protein PLA83_06625 [Deltaproteobacteria bacterium]|nr:hypothetical protein [Deltaproteobacteria bacterium]
MKRVLSFVVLMLLPLCLMAMKPVSDSTLSNVTGQSGVSIDIDVAMNITFDSMGWGDTDGDDGTGPNAGGWIGIDDLEINTLHIWPRTDYSMEATGAAHTDGGWSDLQLLTIDVVTVPFDSANDPNFSAANQTALTAAGGVTKVRIGIPTLTITMNEMSGNVVLGPNASDTTIGGIGNSSYANGGGALNNGYKAISRPNFNQLMGKFYIGGMNMATGTGGAVLISAHGRESYTSTYADSTTSGPLYGSGVTIELDNMKIDYLIMNQLAWGDIDGAYDESSSNPGQNTAPGLTNEGWVGLADLAIRGITINGKIMIDVGTVTVGSQTNTINADGPSEWDDYIITMDERYGACLGTTNRSFVAIMIADGFSVRMEEMGAKVQLGSSNALGETMGDIYVSDMRMTIIDNPTANNRSFVHIFAH